MMDGVAQTPSMSCRSGKRRYGDRIAALLALANTTRSDSQRRNEVRAYRCPECQGWHLSSKAAYERPRLARWEPGRKRKYSPPQIRQESSQTEDRSPQAEDRES